MSDSEDVVMDVVTIAHLANGERIRLSEYVVSLVRPPKPSEFIIGSDPASGAIIAINKDQILYLEEEEIE